jgi:hypothetical protein
MLFAAGAFGGNVYGNQLVIFGQNWNVVTETTSNFLNWHVLLHSERPQHAAVDFLVDSIAVMKQFNGLVEQCNTNPVFVTLGWLEGYSWTPIEQTKMTTDSSETTKLRWITEFLPKFSFTLSALIKSIINLAANYESTTRYAWVVAPHEASYEKQMITTMLQRSIILVDTNSKTAHIMSELRCALMMAFNEIENLMPCWKQLEDHCISECTPMNWTLPSDEDDSAAALASALESMSTDRETFSFAEKLKEHLALCHARLFPLGQAFNRQHNRIKGFHWDDVCGRDSRVQSFNIPLRKFRCWASLSGLGGVPCIFAKLRYEAIQVPVDGRYRVSGKYWMTAFLEDIYRHRWIPKELDDGLVGFPGNCKGTIVRARDHIPSTAGTGSVWDIVQSHVHDSAKATKFLHALKHFRDKPEPETSVVRNGMTVFS